jgi:hypothetical protein
MLLTKNPQCLLAYSSSLSGQFTLKFTLGGIAHERRRSQKHAFGSYSRNGKRPLCLCGRLTSYFGQALRDNDV